MSFGERLWAAAVLAPLGIALWMTTFGLGSQLKVEVTPVHT